MWQWDWPILSALTGDLRTLVPFSVAQPNPPGPMMNSARPMMNMGPGGQQMMNQPNPNFQQPYNQFPGGPTPNPAYPPGSSMGMGAPQRPQQPPQYHPGMYPTGGNPNAGMHMSQQPRYPGMGMGGEGMQRGSVGMVGGRGMVGNEGMVGSEEMVGEEVREMGNDGR